MTEYVPPLRDIRFVLEQLVDLDGLSKLEPFAHADPDTVLGVIEESGRFMAEVVAPLNRVGDTAGSTLDGDGTVTTPPGFKEAYRQYVEAGWGAVPFPAEYGGGGFPWLVGVVMQEMLTTANMAFSLCPLLTQGAIDMLPHHGSAEQQATYLPKMVTGEWTGTMNLTEPQAGSDVGAVRTKAVPAGDGTWRITGQKIFITFGEHDLADNIIHLVLARTPDAPPGTKGISCFIVPKFLVNDDGSLGERNDVRCVSIEHKMGIKASPTCVMSYGEAGGAVGYLIGEENQGMRYMFTMMNNARLSVGLEGLALAERAYQDALRYAQERRQGRAAGAPAGEQSPIIEHPDVRRMLLTMKASIEAMRALIYTNAVSIDLARHHPDPAERRGPAGAGRPADADLQGLVHRPRRRGDLARPPGLRRHGLHRGDRRGPALARRPHHPDLRGHQRHPGHGPGRAQAADARRRRGGRPAGPDARRSTRSWPRPAPSWPRSGPRWPAGLTRCGKRPAGSCPTAWPSPATPWPGRRPTCGCSRWSSAAG